MNATLTEIAARIKAAKSAVILTHMRPDGDAFGSALGLSAALDRLGIPNTVCDESDIPSNLAFLEGTEKIQKQLPEAELYIAVDSSDEQRLGALAEPFRAAAKKHDTVNIDHHVSNTRFARYDFVRLCSANCMNILALVETLGVPLDKKIAGYLLLGILTDSGNFSHDDVTEETFLAAAKLTRAGAAPAAPNYNMFRRQPKARAELYADALGHIRWLLDDRFAVILLTLDKMKKYGADNGMTEGFVDFPLTVESVEVSASVMEVKKGQYKISLRSKKYADVNKIAGVYGGGGHVRAAGCMLFGEPEEVIDRLSYTVSQYL